MFNWKEDARYGNRKKEMEKHRIEMTDEKKEKQEKALLREFFKILVTALITSIATCCFWCIQTGSENKRQDKYKKIELVQDYVEVMVRYEQIYQLIIDNKQLWIQASLLNEYNYNNNPAYKLTDTSEFAEKEEIYRAEYREILAEYFGLLSTIDILFDAHETLDANAQKAQEELQKGFGFEYDKYTDYFWTQVESMGDSVSEQEIIKVFEEINRMSDEDSMSNFFLYSQQYLNDIRKLIK